MRVDDVTSKPISIHAPTRGATAVIRFPHHVSTSFQSTLPRGERHNELIALPNFEISIHAPTRGATAIFTKNTV